MTICKRVYKKWSLSCHCLLWGPRFGVTILDYGHCHVFSFFGNNKQKSPYLSDVETANKAPPVAATCQSLWPRPKARPASWSAGHSMDPSLLNEHVAVFGSSRYQNYDFHKYHNT